ncbi:MAG: CcdB family protein [Myxococcota bacterium]
MPQFDVFRNPGPGARTGIPYLLDVQSDLLRHLATRVVIPLCRPSVLEGKPARYLNPAFEVEGKTVLLLTPQIAGVPKTALGVRVGNLAKERDAIIRAVDMVLAGI